MPSINNARMQALNTLEDVQLEAVDSLLKAWSAELAKSWEAVIEEGKRLEEAAKEKAIEQAHERAQEAMDLALDHQIEHYLQGLRSIAHDKSFHISIPEGARAASSSIQGPASSIIQALIADIQFEDRDAAGIGDDDAKNAQASAAWALGQGLMPHPGDLSTLLQRSPADADWGTRFQDVADTLNKIDTKPAPNAHLKMITASERLDALKEYCDLLGAYSGERLVTAVANPNALTLSAPPPVQAVNRPGRTLLPERQFGAMLDAFQQRRTPKS
ncbi:MAG: hypothetical protein U1E65_16785 [Myxococcota bacterium]